MSYHKSGCCHKCGSPACGGACSDKKQVVEVLPPVHKDPVVIQKDKSCNPLVAELPAIPQPKLPEKLCIEICCDDGQWHCCTINTSIAAILLADESVARISNQESAEKLLESFLTGFMPESANKGI